MRIFPFSGLEGKYIFPCRIPCVGDKSLISGVLVIGWFYVHLLGFHDVAWFYSSLLGFTRHGLVLVVLALFCSLMLSFTRHCVGCHCLVFLVITCFSSHSSFIDCSRHCAWFTRQFFVFIILAVHLIFLVIAYFYSSVSGPAVD